MKAKTLLIATILTIGYSAHADTGKLLWNGNNHFYQRFDNSTITWEEAKTYCANKGAHLATITSDGENTFVETNLLNGNLDYFLGASDAATEGTWKWITGEAWNYTNWRSGDPSNGSGDDYLLAYTFGWWDATANHYERAGFICEWSYNTFINSAIVPDLNANNKAEIATLYLNYKNGVHTVKINDSYSGSLLSSLTFSTNYTPPLGIVVISDMNGNGIPEIAVLAGNVVYIKDAKNNNTILAKFGTMIDNFGVSTGYAAKNISVSADLNGNGSSEISIIGVKSSNGKSRTEIRDSKTGQLINKIELQ